MIEARPEHVWAAFRDVGAIHERLLPGRVVGTRLDGDLRILTFADGREVQELIVDVDDEARRLAYAVVGGGRMPIKHHHASFQILAEGPDQTRLVWVSDVLPHAIADSVRARVERGAEEMKLALEQNLPTSFDPAT